MELNLSPLATALLDSLSHRPADSNQNPYSLLSDELDAQLLPTLPRSAANQLYFLAALYGLAGTLVLISQVIRWRKGIVWFYRWQSEYTLIRPHATLSWSPLAVVVVALFELLIVRTIQLVHGNAKADYGYILLMVWGSAWVAGAVATWSIAASYVVHLQTTSRTPPSKLVSIACNFAGIASPIIYLAILLPLGIIAGRRYAESQNTAMEFKRFLANGAERWSTDDPFSIADLSPGLPLLDLLVMQTAKFVRWWKAVFCFYAVSAIVVLLGLTPTSILYLTSLRKAIKRTSRDLHQTSLVATARPPKQLNHTWLALVFLATSFSILATIFFVVSLYAYLHPASLRHNPTFEGLIFTPLYAFGCLGLPVAIVLVIRAVEARSSDKRLEKKKGGGIGTESSSGCWSALWKNDKHARSGGSAAANHDVAKGGGRVNDSIFVSFGEMLRGGTRSGTGCTGKGRSGSRGDLGYPIDSRKSWSGRRREESETGIGSHVMVDIQVEVREEDGAEDDIDVDEKELRAEKGKPRGMTGTAIR
ncbi:uncharacterized protein JCM6883_006421 [Sporobolomyces salmoneus]|uniref:uncharacterized protein n=1 Tax=Sporobolomyces salmoneus TaxID=183962 RepID=UPI00316DC344